MYKEEIENYSHGYLTKEKFYDMLCLEVTKLSASGISISRANTIKDKAVPCSCAAVIIWLIFYIRVSAEAKISSPTVARFPRKMVTL